MGVLNVVDILVVVFLEIKFFFLWFFRKYLNNLKFLLNVVDFFCEIFVVIIVLVWIMGFFLL